MRYRCTWCGEDIPVLALPDEPYFHYCADGRYGLIKLVEAEENPVQYPTEVVQQPK